ncbi:MAG TPA: DUF998 domain-containing protein [Ktedonobacterales bacterium]|nr:DUF998 domain-containing protein [Ktedonobacterales bacterium]
MFFRQTHQPAPSLHATADLDPLAATSVPQTLLVWLTIGIAGTLLFPITYLIEGATRPGYDAWRDTISALSFGSTGWVQQLNFALCGVSVIWLAFVWRRILAGGICATWYPILRGIEGFGLVAIAFITRDPLHTICLIVIVNAMTFGLFVIARRFWRRPRWRGWGAFSVACGLLTLVCMSFFGASLNPQSALSGYTGLFERVATNADTLWSLVLLIRLWTRRSIGI